MLHRHRAAGIRLAALYSVAGAAQAQGETTQAVWAALSAQPEAALATAFALGAALSLVTYWRLRRERAVWRSRETKTEAERKRLNAILNRSGVGVAIVERDTVLFDVNHRWCKMFGYDRRDARGRLKAREMVLHEDAVRLDAYFRDLLAGRVRARTHEWRFLRRDGSTFWGVVNASLVADEEGGKARWCVAMITDIDVQKKAEERLRESEERLRFITENTQDAVWKLDEGGRFTYVNGADERMRGFARGEVIGREFKEWLTPAGCEVFDEALLLVASRGGGDEIDCPMHFEVEMRCKDGRTLWAEVNSAPFHGPDGRISGYIGVTRDITERRRAQEKLLEQTIRDPLTQLFNRRFLDESFESELARARRDGRPLAVLMIDIDRFKLLNDTHGHLAGDAVLRHLGDLLGRSVRGGDLPCRYGGEEFLLLLPDMSGETAVERAEYWRRQFAAEPTRFLDLQLQATISTGVAFFPAHGDTREALIHAADQALYAAKRDGRNRVAVASSPAAPVKGE